MALFLGYTVLPMIKNSLLIIFLSFGIAVHAQFTVDIKWQQKRGGSTGDTIYYDQNRKLSWDDFKGRPDSASPAAAITQSGFGYKMNMQSVNRKTNVEIIVFCYFTKTKSWVKSGNNNSYALRHEQHHYDITYLNTVLFVQKLKETWITKENFKTVVNKIYDECFVALNKMQNEYDGQTSNGRKPLKQAEWNKKIDLQLATLPIN
jgi:hypothetical protein